jgi:hypothetical protein
VSTTIGAVVVDRVGGRRDETAGDSTESKGDDPAFGDVLHALAGASAVASQVRSEATASLTASTDEAVSLVHHGLASATKEVGDGGDGATEFDTAVTPGSPSSRAAEATPADTSAAPIDGSGAATRGVDTTVRDAGPLDEGAAMAVNPSAANEAASLADTDSHSVAAAPQPRTEPTEPADVRDADPAASARRSQADRPVDGPRQATTGNHSETAVARIGVADSRSGAGSDSDPDTKTTVMSQHAAGSTADSVRSTTPTGTAGTTSHRDSDPSSVAAPTAIATAASGAPADDESPLADAEASSDLAAGNEVDMERESAELRPADTVRPPRANGAGSTGSAPATSLIERAEQAEHIAEMARASIRRSGDLTQLGLDVVTDDLGVIRVEAMDRRGGLQLNLASHDPATRALLNERLPELLGDLRDAGVDVGSLDISGGRQHDRSGTGDGTETSGTRHAGERAVGAANPPTADTRLTTIRRVVGNADGLDLRL